MELNPRMSAEDLAALLERPQPYPMPNGWQRWPVAAQAHQTMMRRFLDRLPQSPEPFAGRGVVICAGGSGLFTCGYICARMLRFTGCRLPIQFWHLGESEMDDQMRQIAADLGAACIDALEVRAVRPARILNGWELKPFALLHCPFREVLLLDADNLPVRDPGYLFQSPQFRKAGAVFWPDFGRLGPERAIWEICQVPYRDEPEVESGQILLDKQRCWKALSLTMWINEHSDYYYAHIHGDKCTFQMAWHILNQAYAMPRFPIEALDATMCQHDFQGRRLFQHRNMDKWRLDGSNRRIAGFLYEDQCREFLAELSLDWSGVVGPPMKLDSSRSLQLTREIHRNVRACRYQHHPVFNQFRGPAWKERRDKAEQFIHKYRVLWAVVRAIRPESIMELGVLDGQSADAFLDACPEARYRGFDAWEYDEPMATLEGEDWDGKAWVEMLFAQRGYPHIQLSRVDLRQLTELPQAEFVLVDGAHDYHNERRDLELSLTAAPRWVCVDDYCGDQGEFAAANDFCEKWSSFIRTAILLDYCHGGGLLIELRPLGESHLAQICEQRRLEGQLAGKRFLYRRKGHDERLLNLAPGGLIGRGSAACELCWRVDCEPRGPVLTLAGEKSATCRLRWDDRACMWKGRWIHHERMPIELIPAD